MADSDHTHFDDNDDDDFEVPLTQTQSPILKPLSQSNSQIQRPSKKPKTNKTTPFPGKENIPPSEGYDIGHGSLDFVPSTLDSDSTVCSSSVSELKKSNKHAYFSNSLESRLVASRKKALDSEVNLCDEFGSSVDCPLCGVDISNLTEEQRNLHTNDCLDKSGEDVRFLIHTLFSFLLLLLLSILITMLLNCALILCFVELYCLSLIGFYFLAVTTN
jgi:hypothetical protein